MDILKTGIFWAALVVAALLAGAVAALLLLWIAERLANRGRSGGIRTVSEVGMAGFAGLFILAFLAPSILTANAFRASSTPKWAALGLSLTAFVALLAYFFRGVSEHGWSRSAVEMRSELRGKAPAPSPSPPRPRPASLHQCAARLLDHPVHGRVLEIALSGSANDEAALGARRLFEEEVSTHRPQHLVINMLGFRGSLSAIVLGALVGARCALGNIAAQGTASLVASGATAAELERLLTSTKLLPLFGGRVHPAIDAALSALSAPPAPRA